MPEQWHVSWGDMYGGGRIEVLSADSARVLSEAIRDNTRLGDTEIKIHMERVLAEGSDNE